MPQNRGLFQESARQVNNDSVLEMGHFEEPQTQSASSGGYKVDGFHSYLVVKLLAVKADMELDRMGWEFKCHNTVAFTFSSLSWINSPWIVASLRLISRV